MLELERDLRGLGKTIVFPPTPDIATAVARDLAPLPTSPWRRRALVAIAVAAFAIGVTMAVPPARTAVLHFFGIGAVHVRFVDRLPEVEENRVVPPGHRFPIDQSPVPLLRSPLLGRPDAVYSDGSTVSQIYGSARSVRLLVTQIQSPGVTPNVVKKIAGIVGTRTSFVPVAGADGPGLWIEGQRHVVRFAGWPERLAGNTLVWLRGDVTVRIEGNLRRDEAVRIANWLR